VSVYVTDSPQNAFRLLSTCFSWLISDHPDLLHRSLVLDKGCVPERPIGHWHSWATQTWKHGARVPVCGPFVEFVCEVTLLEMVFLQVSCYAFRGSTVPPFSLYDLCQVCEFLWFNGLQVPSLGHTREGCWIWHRAGPPSEGGQKPLSCKAGIPGILSGGGVWDVFFVDPQIHQKRCIVGKEWQSYFWVSHFLKILFEQVSTFAGKWHGFGWKIQGRGLEKQRPVFVFGILEWHVYTVLIQGTIS
jgi:hypothetical protein